MMHNTHLGYIAETCSTMQRLVNNTESPTMQNTHYGALRVIHTALAALSHTLKILFEHRSLRPQKLLLLSKQSLCP